MRKTQLLEISVAVAQFPAVHVCNIVIAIAVAHGHTLKAMMELTMSLPFSFKALTAFFLDTEAWVMTSSMSLLSRPVSSTSSSSSSSSSAFFASSNLPFPVSPWSWPACGSPALAASEAASCCAAEAWACELRSSILASPKMLLRVRTHGVSGGLEKTYIQVLLVGER